MFTSNLRKDHLTIKRLRNIAKQCSDLLYEGKYIPYDDIKELVITIEEFIDKCHHSKEECSFFPTLKYKELQGEIDALLIEHEFGRRVAKMVSKALDEWLKSKDIEPVARLLNAYVTFLDLHMEREEKFFDLIDENYNIDNIVNEDIFKELSDKMAKIRDKIDKLEAKAWYEGSN
ncbi:MAG: hemerythrin [Candidatus Nitrosocaldaceae archaeon]|nr:MAG: hemerythrin [Candidatus Nitrosocaldaceae archaeon]